MPCSYLCLLSCCVLPAFVSVPPEKIVFGNLGKQRVGKNVFFAGCKTGGVFARLVEAGLQEIGWPACDRLLLTENFRFYLFAHWGRRLAVKPHDLVARFHGHYGVPLARHDIERRL